MEVYCSKRDCTFRKTTKEYSRSFCSNTKCKSIIGEPKMETEAIIYCVDEQYNRYKYEPP